jgi:hypothetical protein
MQEECRGAERGLTCESTTTGSLKPKVFIGRAVQTKVSVLSIGSMLVVDSTGAKDILGAQVDFVSYHAPTLNCR